ncbi:CHAT domain-containing protein [Nostoc sp. CHAB 5836]|uniref:CHAT domain-containing protein n=1 Tax=Nostoc sp. CHAB 5836 TaxID=2780404 RepID=UPI001E52214D|nr:CHAT domain-containing protein [Nostoc sp. CHAB 5836]MCC5617392.1 CHAT domain-containing protein [Nostoc sp. CHAB 5836]
MSIPVPPREIYMYQGLCEMVLQLLLALFTAFLCIALSPVLAKPPAVYSAMQNLSEQGTTSPTLYSLLPFKSGRSQTERLVEEGKKLYDTGQFTETVKVLQQAAAAFRASRDGLREAMTLSNLCLAYQQLGLWAEAKSAIAQSLNLLQSGENTGASGERLQIIAQALDVQGQLQLTQGQTQAALTTWQKAADIYQQIGDRATLTRNRINSAQALQALGLYLQANKILNEVEQTLTSLPDSLIVATGLRSLGNVRRVVGDLNLSRLVLTKSLAVAERVQSPKAIAEAQLSLGNTARAQQDLEAALQYYQQAAAVSVSPITRIQADLNLLSLLLETNKDKDALALSSQIHSEISNLPPSRTSVYTQIKFAQTLAELKKKTTSDTPSWLDIAQQVSTAIKQAQSLQDVRAESYAQGTLGELYEKTGQLSDAQDLTEKALFIAQTINASDIAYQWQWQLGRILKKKGDIKGAIASYNVAYDTLESLRGDLVAINPDVQFSFRENVEPVYRELVELLLRSAEGSSASLQETDALKVAKADVPSPQEVINQDNLKQARNVIESLQLAELDNFFRSACLNPTQELDPVVDKKDQQAAVIYPIILPDRLDVILKLPNQDLRYYKTVIAQDNVEKIIGELRKNLLDVTATFRVQQQSQQIYDWLIRPAEAELAKSGIKTLVFVLDGELRNIPMAVLYDQQQEKYLVEKYAIALTPGLQLLNPKPLRQVQLNALIAGVSEKRPVQGREFPQLQNVPRELKEIQSEISKNEELLNQEFTETNLQKKLQTIDFTVVHLATHGEFSSDAEKTFILTWDKLVNVKEFDNLLRVNDKNRSSGIELLVLSACKTAEGDKRAALGLAGMAVRAGARSTLATLWSVDDRSTADVMSEFYRQLNLGVNKAEALHRAQLAVFVKDDSPNSWAPYVLLGNWL